MAAKKKARSAKVAKKAGKTTKSAKVATKKAKARVVLSIVKQNLIKSATRSKKPCSVPHRPAMLATCLWA